MVEIEWSEEVKEVEQVERVGGRGRKRECVEWMRCDVNRLMNPFNYHPNATHTHTHTHTHTLIVFVGEDVP